MVLTHNAEDAPEVREEDGGHQRHHQDAHGQRDVAQPGEGPAIEQQGDQRLTGLERGRETLKRMHSTHFKEDTALNVSQMFIIVHGPDQPSS